MQAVEIKKSHAICGAKTRSGAPCKGKPMRNGRCRMHGGKAGRPPKHGLYSKYLSDPVRARYEEFLADPHLKDLRHEIARLRALLAGLDDNDHEATPLVIQTCETIAKLVVKKDKIEVGERFTISIENVQYVVNQVVAIISRHVQDEKIREVIALELDNVALVERGERGEFV